MSDLSQVALEMQRFRFADARKRTTAAIAQLADADVNWRPNEASNSIANIVLHLAGNLQSRVEASIGGAPDQRNRDREFADRNAYTRDEILNMLNGCCAAADKVFAELTAEKLAAPNLVRGKPATTLEAVFSAVIHFAEHAGQILYIAKMLKGDNFQALSTPHRKA